MYLGKHVLGKCRKQVCIFSLLYITCVPSWILAQETPRTFSFGAAGDFGARAATESTFRALASSPAEFFLALGDLAYGEMSENDWANSYVKNILGAQYPFELIGGNHDEKKNQQGSIIKFAQALPDRLNSVGRYGVEYYFDYTFNKPLARIILISPDLQVDDDAPTITYAENNKHMVWLSTAIDNARMEHIPWIIVAMHKVCLSASDSHAREVRSGCEIGIPLMNLLIDKKVDLVLQGHEHSYQRSKQLSCGDYTIYKSTCVANPGNTGAYTQGAGTVFVIAGTGGHSILTKIKPRLEPYFATYSKAAGWSGFVLYTVTPSRIDVSTQFSGDFKDTFSITAP